MGNEKYYNLSFKGEQVDDRLTAVNSKLNKTEDTAAKLQISEMATGGLAATNKKYVDDTVIEKIRERIAALDLDANYLRATSVFQDPDDPELQIPATVVQLANNTVMDFGNAGQILASQGSGKTPKWIINPNISLIIIDEENNGNCIADVEASGHQLTIVKEKFIKVSDLEDNNSDISQALDEKVDKGSFYPLEIPALIIGDPTNGLQLLHAGELGQVLKIGTNNLIGWANEKELNLEINDDPDTVEEDVISVVATLSYEDPVLSVARAHTVNYSAYKMFEQNVNAELADKATKLELQEKANISDLGDQFTVEFDSETGTLTLIKLG